MNASASLQDSLSLKDLIRSVQRELAESQKEREASGDVALFEVEKLTLEINFVVTKSKSAKAGFDFKVLALGGLNIGGSGDLQEQQVHKITLSLKTVPNVSGILPFIEPEGRHPCPPRR